MTSAVVNIDIATSDPGVDELWAITSNGGWSLLITPHSDVVIAYLSGTLDELDEFFDRGKAAVAGRRGSQGDG